MTTKAIITRRGMRRSNAAAMTESTEARDLGLNVTHLLPQGTLVVGDERQYAALEARGYRVKLLPDTNILEVGAYRIDTEAAPPKVPTKLEVPKALQQTWPHHLVQLAAPPQAAWIQAIAEQGVEVVEPISAYGLFVVGSPAQVNRLKQLPFVEWVGPFKPAYRLSPNLQQAQGKLHYVNIGIYPATAIAAVRATVQRAGGNIIHKWSREGDAKDIYSVLIVELEASKLAEVATAPAVRWVEFQGPPALADERSDQIVAENLDGAPPPNNAPVVGYQAMVTDAMTGLGLSGAGVIVGICDSGVDNHDNATMHLDLRNRMAFFEDVTEGAVPIDDNGHGTHVAGIAVGNGATGDTDHGGFLLGLGMAPGAQFGSLNGIVNNDLAVVVGYKEWAKRMAMHGTEVMNNSWETLGTIGAGYTAVARDFDRMVRDPDPETLVPQQMAIVFAASNHGPQFSTISSPAVAKNNIAVGNSHTFRPVEGETDDIRNVHHDSSRGPTPDGRMLPTVIAPGSDIGSARPADIDPLTPGLQPPYFAYTDKNLVKHEAHMLLTGTSMAAPHIAGLCALLIEWWRKRTGGRTPSPALLKALIINGAIDMVGGTTGRKDGMGNPVLIANLPNNDQGWGRASLPNIVLQAPASDRGPKIFSDQRHAFTTNGQEHIVRVAPVDPMRPLRITLVWTDAVGAVNANPALVNDLDLEVTELATNKIYRGNVFANGFSTIGGNFDNRNNVECVYLQNPAGTYVITVIAASIAASAHPDILTPWQDFALVIDNAEYAAAAPVSVVPVIDRSGSMVTAGYVDITRLSSKQFVDLLSIDDKLGIVSFGSTATVEYPAGLNPKLQTITGQAVREAAKAEIDGIAFTGCTYMGAGINAARDLLSAANGPRAMVLFSDGYDNKGCELGNPAKPSALDAVATLPANLPVYTCAMGPTSDQELLAQIAEATDGRYYYMPAIDDLFEIYNYIRGQITGDAIVVNEAANASSSRVGGFVDALATEATFTVAWANPKLRFVVGEPRRANDLSIKLRDPRGQLLHPSDSYVRRMVGAGHVAFKIGSPMPGKWYVEVATAGDTHVRYTVGGFVKSPLHLSVSLRPSRGLATLPLNITARVVEGQLPLAGFRASARVVSPSLGIPALLAKYKAQLQAIKPGRAAGGDGVPVAIAKLRTLNAKRLRTQKPDLFTHEVQPVALRSVAPDTALRVDDWAVAEALPIELERVRAAGADRGLAQPAHLAALPGVLVGQFRGTQQPGSYNVIVNVEGISPSSNTRFVRKELVSVLVR